MEISPRLDAVLVHTYLPKSDNPHKPGERGELSVTAAKLLYETGRAERFVVAGGQINQAHPHLATVLYWALNDAGIPSNRIITKYDQDGSPVLDTSREIDAFLLEASIHGWANIASLASRTHTFSIRSIYQHRDVSVPVLTSEAVVHRLSPKKYRHPAGQNKLALYDAVKGLACLTPIGERALRTLADKIR